MRCLIALFVLLMTQFGFASAADRPPNVVVVFMDDMGYADIHPFGDTKYPTPNLDRMADEGRKFTDFVVSSAVCSASTKRSVDRLLSPAHRIRWSTRPQSQHWYQRQRDDSGGDL